MKKILFVTMLVNLSLYSAIGDGLRIDSSTCYCIEYNDCDGYCF